jgi:hypothetical protein
MRGGQIDVACRNSRSINVLAGLTQRFRRKRFALGGAISLATGYDSSINWTAKLAPLAPFAPWKVVAATAAFPISLSLSQTRSTASSSAARSVISSVQISPRNDRGCLPIEPWGNQ